jgi:hypothetical protein
MACVLGLLAAEEVSSSPRARRQGEATTTTDARPQRDGPLVRGQL